MINNNYLKCACQLFTRGKNKTKVCHFHKLRKDFCQIYAYLLNYANKIFSLLVLSFYFFSKLSFCYIDFWVLSQNVAQKETRRNYWVIFHVT